MTWLLHLIAVIIKNIIKNINTYLAQHAQADIDGGQQGPKWRSHVGVKSRSCEAKHEERAVLGQVHRLIQTQRQSASHKLLFLKISRNVTMQQEQTDLVQEYLAAVWGEVLQSCQGFAEDL